LKKLEPRCTERDKSEPVVPEKWRLGVGLRWEKSGEDRGEGGSVIFWLVWWDDENWNSSSIVFR
jgi:hypothetical protein